MKKLELEKLLNEINQKIGSADDLQQKIADATQTLVNAQSQVTDLTTKSQQASELLAKAQATKTEIDGWSEKVKKGSEDADNYEESIQQQNKEYSELKTNLEELKKSYEELEQSAKDQLGLVSMESLANAFAGEATKLEKSTSGWFNRIFWTSIALMAGVLGVAIWQVVHEQTLLKLSFAIRIPIISPIIYYLYFVVSQYKREKRLLEEYSFKASIARSFEAYRKVLKEESANDQDLLKKNELIIGTIKDVYSSPMKNIADNKIETVESKDHDFDLLNKIIEYGDKIKNLFVK